MNFVTSYEWHVSDTLYNDILRVLNWPTLNKTFLSYKTL